MVSAREDHDRDRRGERASFFSLFLLHKGVAFWSYTSSFHRVVAPLLSAASSHAFHSYTTHFVVGVIGVPDIAVVCCRSWSTILFWIHVDIVNFRPCRRTGVAVADLTIDSPEDTKRYCR